MPDYSLLFGLLLVLGSALLGGLLAQRLRQPIIFGYLIAGLAVSQFTGYLGLNQEGLKLLAEIGLAFLMFTLGLEFSLKKISAFRRIVIGGAAGQIVLTTTLVAVLLRYFFNLELSSALIAGSAFSLSSTAIVVKLLAEKGRLESLPGEIMIGWLLIQDLAVLPMIGLLPVLFNHHRFSSNLVTMGAAALILLFTWLAGQKIVPRLADFIASFKSRELLLLFVVAAVFVFALFTSNFGFSFGLGAFLAGLILSQAASHFAVFSEVRPLRDVFLALFFVSLGLSLEPGFLMTNFKQIILIAFVVMAIKLLVVLLILVLNRFHAKTVINCSFGLAQVGEFSFVLASVALAGGYLERSSYFLIVSVTLLTMVLTPWFFSLADKAYWHSRRILGRFPGLRKFYIRFDRGIPAEELPFENHAVILGFGRVGKWVGSLLDKAGIPYVVVEYNPVVIRNLKLEEKRVIFGDPTDIDVLDLAQVDKARLVVVTIPDSLTQKIIMANCRVLNSRSSVICRSHIEEDLSELKDLGADYIIHPEFEAALSMGHRVLQIFGFSQDEINKTLKEIKKEHEMRSLAA